MNTADGPMHEGLALSEESLLAELGWVRQLALSLVRDPAVADDVAQEAYRLARERPPREVETVAGLRAWLARVTRSLVRGEARRAARRARREARVARPERDDTDLLLAIAVRRDVAAAVLTLAEPYRGTLLRFHFEERTVAEIAALSRVSEDAVRQRLVRARAALRERLAQDFGGPRGWVRALLPLLTEADEPAGRRSIRTSWIPWAAAGLLVLAGGLWIAASRPAPTPAVAPPVRYAYQPQEPPLAPDALAARRRGGLARWLVAPPDGPLAERPTMLRQASLFRPFARGPRDEAARLSADLSIPIANVRAREDLPGDLRAKVAEHSGHSAEFLQAAELFEGTCTHPRSRETVPVRVVRMPLDSRDPEVRLVVVVHEERALTLGVWGTEDFDEDPGGRWAHYAQLLTTAQSTGPPLSFSSPSAAALTALRTEYDQRLDEDAELIRALVDQRLLMGVNVLHSRIQRALPRGETGPADWFVPIANRFRTLAASSARLAPVLGEAGAKEHSRLARDAAGAFDGLAAAARGREPERIQHAVDQVSAACRACHNARTAEGTEFFDAFGPFVDGLDLPRGVLFVGLDLPSVLGGDEPASRNLAAGFRAALLLANEAP